MVDAVLARNTRVGAQLITRAESGTAAMRPVLQLLYKHGGGARVVGITGPPGSGKSTLVDQLIGWFRKRGLRIAVVAVDPSSPISGGALLGDRLRMSRHDGDPEVFIRSMATRGLLGGLSKAVGDAVTILDAMGWNVILIETVGVGQSEIDIVRHAACVVLLQTASSGDAVQMGKAGVLEIGDIFVVNKDDMSGSGRIVSALNEMLGRRIDHGEIGRWQPTVVRAEAITGKGVAEIAELIGRRFDYLADHPAAARAQKISQLHARAMEIAEQMIGARLCMEPGPGSSQAKLLVDVLERKEDPYAYAEALFHDRVENGARSST
jgi:LAO/AO transport system kinase